MAAVKYGLTTMTERPLDSQGHPPYSVTLEYYSTTKLISQHTNYLYVARVENFVAHVG